MFEQVEVFYRPTSVREAVRLLASGKGRARLVAGGTDLVVHGDSTVRALIDITHSGLTYIRKQAGVCAIGAATTMAELEASPAIHGLAGGVLARGAGASGSRPADLVTPLLAMDAVVVLADANGRRKLPLAEYMVIRGSKALRQSLLVEVIVPQPS